MESVLLVAVKYRHYEYSLQEMISLIETLDAHVDLTVTMHKDLVSNASYLGKGKIEEVRGLLAEFGMKTLVINDNISPAQKRELEETLKVKVLDRTEIILAIFAKRAMSMEAQIQVEMAQLRYLMPRLTRMWTHLSRQQGGIGLKGAGEKQIETDRRVLRSRATKLKKDLEDVRKSRDVQRKQRIRSGLPVVALVGYTNSGKSSLFNAFNGKSVLAKDQLFATLDTVVKKVVTPNNCQFYIVDTVGFISELPHFLIEAFKATLEEVMLADVLIHVIDRSNPNFEAQIEAVNEVLHELKIDNKPIILVYNKLDKIAEPFDVPVNGVAVSVTKGLHMDKLVERIEHSLA